MGLLDFIRPANHKALSEGSNDTEVILKHSKLVAVPGSINLQVRLAAIPCEAAGKSSTVMVFIHGLGGQLNQFAHQLDYFPKFYSCIAIDLPGHGKSPVRSDGNYSTAANLEVCESILSPNSEILELLGNPTNIVVVGHSLGSQLAAQLCLNLKERCTALVALAPPVAPSSLPKIQSWLPYLPTVLFDAFRAVDSMGGIESKSISRVCVASNDDTVREARLRNNLQINSTVWLGTVQGWQPVTEAQFKEIKVPVLVLCASQDHMVKRTDSEAYAAAISQVTLETVENAGHILQADEPETVNAYIRNFISTQLGS